MLDALLIVVILVSLASGFALFNYCGGGASLALFGVAAGLLGYTLFRSDAWATIIPSCIVTLTLVVAGWYAASVAGCVPW
jgi:Ca2+/Na+ antiporter